MRHDISRDTARFPLVAVATRANSLACQRDVFGKLSCITNPLTSYELRYADGKIINHEIKSIPSMDYKSNNGRRTVRKLNQKSVKFYRFWLQGKMKAGLYISSWRRDL